MDEESEKLNLIIETTRLGPRQQLVDVDALDTKVTQVFAAGSVVMGLAAFLVDAAGGGVVTAFLIVAGLAYVVCAGGTLYALYPRTYYGAHMADSLFGWSDDRSLKEIQTAIAKSVPEAWEKNRRALKPKECGVTLAMCAVALEVFLVTAALVASRVIG